jgi:hypothetical protein
MAAESKSWSAVADIDDEAAMLAATGTSTCPELPTADEAVMGAVAA